MIRNFSIKARLVGVLVFLSLQLIAGGILCIVSLSQTNNSMQAIYDDRVVPMEQLDMIIRGTLRDEVEIVKATKPGQHDLAKIVDRINERIAAVDAVWSAYLTTVMTPEENQLADQFVTVRQKYLAEGIRPAIAALQAGDIEGAHAIVHGPLQTLLEQIRTTGDALIKLQRDVAKSQYEQSQRRYRLVRDVFIAAMLFSVALAAVVGWWLVQAITKPLDTAVRLATSMAEGNLTCKIDVRSNDETGRLMQALKNMRDSLVQKTTMARLGAWQLDPATQKMTWSTETFRLFGMGQLSETPEFSGFLQRIHEEDRPRIQEGLARTIATGAEFTAEHRILRLDGTLHWVQAVIRRSDNDGKMLLRGTLIDITERRQTLDALERSQGLLRELTAHQNRAKEDERRRIAREIHDELGQTLLALRLDVSMLATRTAQAHPRLNQRVCDVLQQLDATMKTVRGIINNLRPAVLDLGLTAAIEWQVNKFRRRSGITCELVLDAEECVLDDQRATTLFRILQESLTNVIRHAKATHVRVELRQDGTRLAMRIADNGIGITAEGRRTANSFGLVGVKERIHALDGEFHIDSMPGKGTALAIYIPLAKTGEVSGAAPPFSTASV